MINVLITGSTGYVGKRIIPLLLIKGYHLICLVRDRKRFDYDDELIEVVECDFLNEKRVDSILKGRNVDYAYYFMHSMRTRDKNFEELEVIVARNFVKLADRLKVKQVIYLTGMINVNNLSPHLRSRKLVEDILVKGNYFLTSIRAGIIIGAGGSSFEIIRDLVEKLPIMVAPKWINTKCQPISIGDILQILVKSLGNIDTYDKDFDAGGADILTYKEMMLEFADVRSLRRHIFVVPILTPRLSSYWLHIVTSQSYRLARHLIDSMHIDFVARDDELMNILKIKPIGYKESIEVAFDKIRQNAVVSSWRESMFYSHLLPNIDNYVQVPIYGCMKDVKKVPVRDREKVINQLWKIGKDKKWYYAYRLWEIRGWMDKLVGGVGFNRNRREDNEIHIGDSIDFWRVINANKEKGILLLYAEMKVPGEAWLEFDVNNGMLIQTATFRPRGLLGRLYWYILLPIHKYMFKGMAKKIVNTAQNE